MDRATWVASLHFRKEFTVSVTFGKRVAGEKEHSDAVAKAAGGAEVFGKRVRGATQAPSAADLEGKGQSEFGPRTLQEAHASGPTGNSSTISVGEIKDILTENPTFFDSLYENELALASGPRKAALEVFEIVELGIKGAGRRHILTEISTLLGRDATTQRRSAANLEGHYEALRGQEQRNEENAKLADLPRLEAMVKREEALKTLDKAEHAGTRSQLLPESEDAQIKHFAPEVKEDKASAPSEPSKPSGPNKPETQAPTKSGGGGTGAGKKGK